MNRAVLCSLAALVLGLPPQSPAVRAAEVDSMFVRPLAPATIAYDFLGYSGVVIRVPQGNVVIDPARLLTPGEIRALRSAGVVAVLYTHGHGDHFDAGVARQLVAGTGATVIAGAPVAAALEDLPTGKVIVPRPGRPVTVGGVTITAVAGKHIGPILLYQVKAGGVTLFHAGDSAPVPLAAFRSDVAFLPVGMPSPTASPGNALRMARDLGPQVVVTMHGTAGEAKDFRRRAAAARLRSRVVIPEEHRVGTLTLR
jgi:L-ascorbate metabolism protein UlaG (beta-lactamase superfamily)